MSNIQQYIDLIKSEKEKADAKAIELGEKRKWVLSEIYEGKSDAFSFCLSMAELLLLKDESKQPQPPDFANTMLGKVPHEVSVEHQKSSQAVEGATPVVRQNEQTKEVCKHQKAYHFHDNAPMYCPDCGKYI